jgi:hypothetical protein
MENKEIDFKPITEGLGFHPFSDGLPYAPVTPTQTKTISRATVPPMLAPVIATPVSAKPVEVNKPKFEVQFIPEFGTHYVMVRLLAYTMDVIFNLTLCMSILGLVLMFESVSMDILFHPNTLFFLFLFFALFNWAIVTAQEVVFRTSLGKRMFGLVLNGNSMRIFLRAFLFIPSLVFGGAGLVWSLFDSKKRCWHDRATQIQPFEMISL